MIQALKQHKPSPRWMALCLLSDGQHIYRELTISTLNRELAQYKANRLRGEVAYLRNTASTGYRTESVQIVKVMVFQSYRFYEAKRTRTLVKSMFGSKIVV